MGWAKIIAIAVITLMALLMGNIFVNDGLMTGIGMDRFIAGLKDPWQAFIGFDMMSGLFIMFGWIVYRQTGMRLIDTIVWVLMGNWWGNIVIAAYILVALRQSQGDAAQFFMGARAGPLKSAWMPSALTRAICLIGAGAVLWYMIEAMQSLSFSGLPAWAFLPAFGPIVASLVLLALPSKPPTN
jgi:ABC-type Co2+ transport system permease subunit